MAESGANGPAGAAQVAKAAPEGAIGQIKSPTRLTPEPLSGIRTVLVVDEEPMVRKLLAGIIRRNLGYRVVEASGVVDAQYLARVEGKIHLLLLDVATLETNALQLALWFRAMYPETRVLVASDSLWELNSQLGISQEVAFLVKPYTPRELAAMVRRVLG